MKIDCFFCIDSACIRFQLLINILLTIVSLFFVMLYISLCYTECEQIECFYALSN